MNRNTYEGPPDSLFRLTFFSSNLNNRLSEIADTLSELRFEGDPERSEGVHVYNDVGGPQISVTGSNIVVLVLVGVTVVVVGADTTVV